MTRIAILPEQIEEATAWRAIAGDKQSVGRTAGEALDAIASQLSDDEGGTLIILQTQRPDRFFTEEQRQRLQTLMAQWREAHDAGSQMPEDAQAELEALIEAEVKATTRRASALLHEITP